MLPCLNIVINSMHPLISFNFTLSEFVVKNQIYSSVILINSSRTQHGLHLLPSHYFNCMLTGILTDVK